MPFGAPLAAVTQSSAAIARTFPARALVGHRRWILYSIRTPCAHRTVCTPLTSASSACAGLVYVFGPASSNECPAGTTRITTRAACQIAAAAMGLTYRVTVFDDGPNSAQPRGGPILSVRVCAMSGACEHIQPRPVHVYSSVLTVRTSSQVLGSSVSRHCLESVRVWLLAGCYEYEYVWFNTHPTGAGASSSRLLCNAGTRAPSNPGDTRAPIVTTAPTTRAPTGA